MVLGPFRGAVQVGGMGTGTREMDVLSPFHLVEKVDAILLTGGSAFGLAAADGVMRWLEERGEGFDTGVCPVPIVPGAVIFDLRAGMARPCAEEGFRACEAASASPVQEGRVGAGAGASVGKVLGPERASEGGVGSAGAPWGEHRVGALAVVNALGDVVGPDGALLAGARGPEGGFPGADALLVAGEGSAGLGGVVGGDAGEGIPDPDPGANTTLVVVGTDAPLSRTDLGRVARMAAGAFPRAISPVNTPFDGDVLFALSSGGEPSVIQPGRLLSLGVLARKVTEEAIRRAVGWKGGEG